ncbi:MULTISPECIES: ArsR/SmtB family transcription factor [Rhizobium]|uniref:ArsR/SmtB family transcription factor n=1 Tax=Rhizobium TaxID=379 RepID=UPI001CC5517C|nr:metalloregulator ArsR/SmtB family transcription factor [Rhizobium sp. VS19-DR96]MBZ5765748.1 metalloregulator ArsR/SmtB family transcription factor [Rhizobium sp. VS19-DR129.2]MBZ5773832.1 metalloregulator ArsR/SmtB family transcription factor [Rhizobium sp. VS19-DRK62.2]MBZ5784904.1 metalloregulator ArsR/SmtB family transcription factor [Rhizobium sp. VS19-DR121]MBZ5802019.1 metalloregulator ArsR/SmtB family transcription factor [Rhizobium sp. VS19-DR181]MBZ5817755.1 metalloregulator ArsR/
MENPIFEQKSTFLSAMANEQRLRVLDILTRGEMPVGALADMIGLSQSALSQHLAKLRSAHMVKTRRDAQTVYYTVNSESVRKVLALLEEIFDAPEVKAEELKAG